MWALVKAIAGAVWEDLYDTYVQIINLPYQTAEQPENFHGVDCPLAAVHNCYYMATLEQPNPLEAIESCRLLHAQDDGILHDHHHEMPIYDQKTAYNPVRMVECLAGLERQSPYCPTVLQSYIDRVVNNTNVCMSPISNSVSVNALMRKHDNVSMSAIVRVNANSTHQQNYHFNQDVALASWTPESLSAWGLSYYVMLANALPAGSLG